jgi:nanoRNase/pAp phosphatase (c-di-AMP/oligoRNAs hydrolase)
MSRASQDDHKTDADAHGRPGAVDGARRYPGNVTRMTSFVESCVETVADTAEAVERRSRGKAHARKLLKVLAGKRNVLITTHEHPDPDALGAALGLCTLLSQRLPDAKVTVSLKGRVGGGVNEVFYRETSLKITPWDESTLQEYDAIVLLDTQPVFAYSPLPAGVTPIAVIDHHRPSRGRKPKCPYCDIRPDVGSATTIIFSYFMELDVEIAPALAAVMLYAIESDLAGAAGQPNELDNIALSGLTLKADAHKLYRMRYAPLPQSYYQAYAAGLNNAMYVDDVIGSWLGPIDSLEKPAVIADFLLRFEQAQWAMVVGIHGEGNKAVLVMSLRTKNPKLSAGDLMRRLLRGIGEGGGHRTKAGGIVKLANGSPTEVERVRAVIRRRFLRALNINVSRGQKLVPPST